MKETEEEEPAQADPSWWFNSPAVLVRNVVRIVLEVRGLLEGIVFIIVSIFRKFSLIRRRTLVGEAESPREKRQMWREYRYIIFCKCMRSHTL